MSEILHYTEEQEKIDRVRKRKFSLENDFMDYKLNDIWYGYMLYLATYDAKNNILYLPKSKYTTERKAMLQYLGYTIRNVNTYVKKYIEKEMLTEGMVEIKKRKVACYIFPQKQFENYSIVANDMLFYIISTRNKAGIQLYAYLLDKYKWKKKTGEQYIFSRKELLLALGYAEATADSPNKTLAAAYGCLFESFAKEGAIKITRIYEQVEIDGIVRSVPKYRLDFVAEHKSQLTGGVVLDEELSKIEKINSKVIPIKRDEFKF